MVVDTLQKAGHTVLPWESYKHPYVVEMIEKIYGSDGGAVSILAANLCLERSLVLMSCRIYTMSSRLLVSLLSQISPCL